MIKLRSVLVEKPWGVTRLTPPFEMPVGKRIGEIWFQGAEQAPPLPLLVKHLFTSQALSIQVHPDDKQAQARGWGGGKEECWYILEAEPGAQLGIGTNRSVDAAELRRAAKSGDIQNLIEWHNVKPGMLFHIPPGTIHAIGAGIRLIEIQQNSDITYRLYDYGRPRELHLDDGADIAKATPFPADHISVVQPDRSAIILEARHFTVAHLSSDDPSVVLDGMESVMVIPLSGMVIADGTAMTFGECAVVDRGCRVVPQPGAKALLAWPTVQAKTQKTATVAK